MSKREEIGKFVLKKLRILQTGTDSARGNAMLANLRRGVGHEPGEMPQLFGIVLEDMPEYFTNDEGNVTKEEWACYTALTLYALHQQGYDIKTRPMHREENISVGNALLELKTTYKDSNAEQRMLKKLQMLATSVDRKELAYHLRGIVQLLRGEGIALNYVQLAENLYDLQYPDGKKRVCLKWGQDFYRKKNQEAEAETGEAET